MILVYSTFTRALASRASATLTVALASVEVGPSLFNLGRGGRELGSRGRDRQPGRPLGGLGGLELANVLVEQLGIGSAICNQALHPRILLLRRGHARRPAGRRPTQPARPRRPQRLARSPSS